MALKAEELMIGNWVNHVGNPYKIMYTVSSVIGFDLDSEVLDTHISNVNIASIQGIPLDESILLKCEGCNYADQSYFYFINENRLYGILKTKNNKYVLMLKCNNGLEQISTEFEHLHTLQNLYILLTGGQQLTFKP